MGAELLRGNRDAARSLLNDHPLQSSKAEIQARGDLANVAEFNFAVAEEFVRFVLGDAGDSGWGDLATKPPRWTSDPERLNEVQAFGRAALGLRLTRTGHKEQAGRELVEAAKARLAVLKDRYRRSHFASPLPFWTDLLLMELAVTATFVSGTPDYDLALDAHVILGRSMASSADEEERM